MVNPISIEYEPSNSIIAQGREVERAKREGYYCAKGGNGSYRMNRPSLAIMTFEVEGEVKSQSVKQLIRDVYGIQKVSRLHADRFFDDVKKGAIMLRYNENFGLSLC